MQGSLSLMQMAKISSVLCDYQSSKKLFYISILTSPTTGDPLISNHRPKLIGNLELFVLLRHHAYPAPDLR
jgi:hypothetical protein